MTSKTNRARKGATVESQVDPTADAATFADTLSYAMQDDADPAEVLKEITAVITPYCQSRQTLGHLRSLLYCAGAGATSAEEAAPTESGITGEALSNATRLISQAKGIVDVMYCYASGDRRLDLNEGSDLETLGVILEMLGNAKSLLEGQEGGAA